MLDRWNTAPTSDGPAILLLEDLINSQSRLAEEETLTVNAETEHAVAYIRYLKAIGSLLQSQNSDATPPLLASTVQTPIQPLLQTVVEKPRPTRLPSTRGERTMVNETADVNTMLDGNAVLPPPARTNERAVRP